MTEGLRRPTTRQMSDRHEKWLAETFGGYRSKNSGAHFTSQMDGRTYPDDPLPLAWDGKSTLGHSVSVSRAMWSKAVEQAAEVEPMLALRWYVGYNLQSALDLVVVDANYLVQLREAAK